LEKSDFKNYACIKHTCHKYGKYIAIENTENQIEVNNKSSKVQKLESKAKI
jgi:hypothetical protein